MARYRLSFCMSGTFEVGVTVIDAAMNNDVRRFGLFEIQKFGNSINRCLDISTLGDLEI